MKRLVFILLLTLAGCAIKEPEVSRPQLARVLRTLIKWADEILTAVRKAIDEKKLENAAKLLDELLHSTEAEVRVLKE